MSGCDEEGGAGGRREERGIRKAGESPRALVTACYEAYVGIGKGERWV